MNRTCILHRVGKSRRWKDRKRRLDRDLMVKRMKELTRKGKRREEKTGQRFIGKWKTRRCKKGEGRKARRLENSSWIGNGN